MFNDYHKPLSRNYYVGMTEQTLPCDIYEVADRPDSGTISTWREKYPHPRAMSPRRCATPRRRLSNAM